MNTDKNISSGAAIKIGDRVLVCASVESKENTMCVRRLGYGVSLGLRTLPEEEQTYPDQCVHWVQLDGVETPVHVLRWLVLREDQSECFLRGKHVEEVSLEDAIKARGPIQSPVSRVA